MSPHALHGLSGETEVVQGGCEMWKGTDPAQSRFQKKSVSNLLYVSLVRCNALCGPGKRRRLIGAGSEMHWDFRIPTEICALYYSAQPAIKKSHRRRSVNNRSFFSHSSGGWRFAMKVSAGLVPSAAVRENLLIPFS